METIVPFEDIDPMSTSPVDFDGNIIRITMAPAGTKMDISDILLDRASFHGSPEVDDLVQFGPALESLRGTFDSSVGVFADRNRLPDNGIHVLSDHDYQALWLVGEIDTLAQRVIADSKLYDDAAFCRDYFGLAKEGFGLVRKFAKSIGEQTDDFTPLTLERAGFVTTRLAAGVELDADVPNEIRVVTKRAHHIKGNKEDLMVSVRWRNLNNILAIDSATLGIADFVNPASGASTLAVLLVARQCDVTPEKVVHESFMASEQGIAFSHRILQTMGIVPVFYTLGTTKHLTDQYYLRDPAVADAGDVLCKFLPEWYKD